MSSPAAADSRNVAIYLSQTIVTTILPILALLLLTRYLGKEDFGALALAQVYAVFAASLCSFGMTEVFERSYFEYHNDKKKLSALLFGIATFVFINFAIVAALSHLFGDQIAALLGFAQPPGLILCAFGGQFLSTAGMIFLLYHRNSGDAFAYAGYMMLASALSVTGSLVLVIYLGIGIVGIPLAQSLAWLFVCLVLAIRIGTVLTFRLDRAIFASTFTLAYPLVPRVFLGAASTQLDKFLLGEFASVGAVGIYSIAQRLAYTVFIFMTMLQNVFSPRVYSQMFSAKDDGDGSLGRYLTPYAYVSVLAALLLVLAGEEVITLALPVEYFPAVGILIVLCMYYGSLFFGKLTGKQLMYAKRPGLISLLSVVSVVISVAISTPLVWKWQAMGAAWGMLVAGILTTTAILLVAQKYYRIRWEWAAMAAIFGVLLIAGLAMLVFTQTTVPYGWQLAVKFVLLGAYLFVGNRLGVVTATNISTMFHGIRLK